MSARPPAIPHVAWRLAAIALATSQIQAMCAYSPPPVVSHGQGADTLGPQGAAVAAEVGWGAAGSWWRASNLGDPEINSGYLGAGRLRLGLGQDLDAGLVGGVGPESTVVFGPELKWRFARLAPRQAAEAPGFHAAVISGLGVGTARYRYGGGSAGARPRHTYLAPYTGVLASGGIEAIQMYSGLRFAASETLSNDTDDLTLYPVLAYGLQVRTSRLVQLYAEGDLVGGITATDTGDSALMGVVVAGVCLRFDEVWGSGASPTGEE